MQYELSLRDYAAIIKRRLWYFLIPFIVISAIGIAIALSLPPVYQASGRILVESQQIPTELIRSTVTGLADERIQIIRQRVMTRANLTRIIDRYGLFSETKLGRSSSQEVDLVRERISIDLVSSAPQRRRDASTIAFNVAYEDQDPNIALRVTNDLVTLFLDENVRTRTERASETTDFLEQESEKLRSSLEQLETQIADYKAENSNALPEQLSMHLNMLERSESELQRIEADRKATEEELRFLRIELAGAKSGLATGAQDTQQLSPAQLLAAARSELVALEARYSDQHPDVISTKRRIQSLEASSNTGGEREVLNTQLAAAQARVSAFTGTYSSTHPEVRRAEADVRTIQEKLDALPDDRDDPDASEFDLTTARLNGQVAAAEARLSVYDRVRGEFKTRIEDLQDRIVQTPEVERGLTALSRDYENSLEKYEDIKAKQLEAQLSQNLEEGKKAERFLLLEPPVLPEEPTKPNRPKVMAFSVLGAGAAGTGLVVLIELLFGGITSPSVLTQIMRQPPLAVIPMIRTDSDVSRRRRKLYLASALAPASIIIGLIAVHVLYMPLDVIVFKAAARF